MQSLDYLEVLLVEFEGGQYSLWMPSLSDELCLCEERAVDVPAGGSNDAY